ncbi:MAG: PAS domain S-box protein, partial [Prosthecobacter sp.]|uniref:hybrid sensor histidine kinase/response regulator n=1 Tax=Prosthecobacter sp. TaxID=1965333 RepID=UPI0019DEF710
LAYRDGRLAECNDVMARMYGLKDAGEMIGKKLDFMLPPEDPQAREFIASIIRAGYRVVDAESAERDAAGNVVHFSNSMTGVVEDGRLRRVWGTQRDISARKRAEEALRESEERHRLLFDRSPLPTFVVDAESLRFLAANDAVLELYGYSWEEFAKLTLLDIRPAEDVAEARDLIASMPASGDVVALRKQRGLPEAHRHRRKDGTVLFVEPRVLELTFNGRRAWLATVSDITRKRQADEHVKWLADFPGQNPNPVIEVDLAERRVFYANRYCVRRFPDLESLGLDHPFLQGIEEAARPLLEGRVEAMGREVFADGSWFIQSLCHLPGTQHVRMYCVNISALKDAEKQLRENEERLLLARDEAEQASRAKDRFLAVLSHELRTPLTPVLMALGALEHDQGISEGVREDLAMMKRNIELETKLIDDLLDISRITSGKLKLEIEPVDLNEVVRHACEICRPQLHECGVRLEAELDPSAGVVSGDPARLQQVLWNVLKNAIKFSSQPGLIRITTRQVDGTHAEVRVQDNGVGIPPERLPHIFNAFEQGGSKVTRKFGGLGLGLAISKALVELHHGTIRAESGGKGQGATFIIELPGKVLTSTARIRLTAPPAGQRMPKLRLLVVEDHADTLRTLTRLLTSMGCTVLTAGSVASAVELAARESFDMVLSDLGLPDGDGREVMRRVRARRNVPGIAMSGYGTDEDVQRSREAGFCEHLTKPVEFSTLKQVILRLSSDLADRS